MFGGAGPSKLFGNCVAPGFEAQGMDELDTYNIHVRMHACMHAGACMYVVIYVCMSVCLCV